MTKPVVSVLAGALPYVLAFTDVDAMPMRFAAAALAVLLALPCFGRANPVSS